MTYMNKNHSLTQLKELLERSIRSNPTYMPESFNQKQTMALELFKQRVFLEEIIDETITYNKNLNWEHDDSNLCLTTTAEELIKVFELRSDIYGGLNYQTEFPDPVEGLNFDNYDKHSAILYYRNNSETIGTIRIIYDKNGVVLPSEEKYSFDTIRNQYNQIAEVSRLIVRHKTNGLNMAFKHLMKGLHIVFKQNDLDMTVSCVKDEHFKLYSKLGGVTVEKSMSAFGTLDNDFVIMSWDLSKTNRFFERSFLK